MPSPQPSPEPSNPLRLAEPDPAALPLWLLPQGADLPSLAEDSAAWARACGFAGRAGQVCLLPGDQGGLGGALLGLGKPSALARDRFPLARGVEALPARTWRLAGAPAELDREMLALGWLLGLYRFDRYKPARDAARPALVCPEGVDRARIEALAAGEALTRDLINTPASDMGPAELEDAARALARRAGAAVEVTAGEGLLGANLPLIHTVGRASAGVPGRAPRLIDLRFPGDGPRLTLVGKGVCFDTGGLDLKPSASMLLMKKDMGGAATVLGLAQMLHDLDHTARMRLRVLIPAVENAVGGDAFRPGDVLRSRKGLTVEVNNTDAEGRLVLADALALAAEERPDWLVSMATLTGAARVALGPDLAPMFCDDDAACAAISAAGARLADPVWRLPFWEPYEAMIEPQVADLDNAPSGGMAGAITAALFLRRFAEGAGRYAHFDVYGWQPSAAPGRPKGGSGQGARALLGALPGLLGVFGMTDRRSTPATDRVAHERLRGVLDRPAWTAGRAARVTVPVTDLCRAPGGARDRQLLFGADLLVIDDHPGWAFVEAAADGYCGWVGSAALAPAGPPATHRVAAPATHVYREPDIKRGEIMSLSLGSRLAGDGTQGRFLRLAGGGFVPLVHVADAPASDPVAVAELLLGTPYLWGGNSRSGIDCSGLVQAALTACGIACPGDSDQQWAALGRVVEDAPRRGDLMFWRGHVALVAGPDLIVHANGHTMSVAHEGLAAACARIEAAGEGPFLGRRRL